MSKALLTAAVVIGFCLATQAASRAKVPIAKKAAIRADKCLPAGTKPDDVVSMRKGKKVTVAGVMQEIGATCKGNKLLSKRGKPIYFYRLTGCWGNAREGYRQIMAEQERKITELAKTHVVIRMTCNPNGGEIK